MDTSTGAATTLDETRARDFYRRAGFDGLAVRGRPSVRPRRGFFPIRTAATLRPDDVVSLIVYPELILRSRPWQFEGVVARHDHDRKVVVIRQIGGENSGTLILIPFRYFEDGRVHQNVSIDDE